MSEDYETRGFPKYQYSAFIGPNRNEQIVVRANDSKEFINAIAKAKEIFAPEIEATMAEAVLDQAAGAANQGSTPQQAIQAPTRKCSFTGCPGFQTYKSGISQKTNKPWQGWFCDTNKEHINWTK